MKRIFCFLILFLVSVLVSIRAETSPIFSFSTPSQNVPVGKISGKINIQTNTPAIETYYLSFTTTSSTGKFVTSTGTSVDSVYISKGDSNRGVYYMDSTAGDFMITTVVSNKAKIQLASLTQHVYVGVPAPASPKPVPVPVPHKVVLPPVKAATAVSKSLPQNTVFASTTATTTVVEVFHGPERKGFVGKLFSWPIRLFDFVRHLFIEG